MRRLWAAGAAIVVCLAPAGMPAAAQESPEPSSESPLPLVTTGNSDCTVLDRGTRGTSDGLVQGAEGARDQILDCVLTMSDPRVSGTSRVTFNDDCFATSVGWECIIWGASLLAGPEGDWDCTYSGTGDPMGGNDGLILNTCTGTGGYSGLTFMAQQAVSLLQSPPGLRGWHQHPRRHISGTTPATCRRPAIGQRVVRCLSALGGPSREVGPLRVRGES